MWRPLIILAFMVEGQEALRLEPDKKVLLAVLNIDVGTPSSHSAGLALTQLRSKVGMTPNSHYDERIRKSHAAYAERHGYDFSVITDWINQTHKGIEELTSFQKLLVPAMDKHLNYDYVVVLDWDILITPFAPAIHTAAQFGDRIGAVDDLQPNPTANEVIKSFMGCKDSKPKDYYAAAGFKLDWGHVLNTGMIVTQPRKHRAILQQIYNTHSSTQITHPQNKDGWFEQAAVGYELHARDMVEWLPAKWNYMAAWYGFSWFWLGGDDFKLPKICCEQYFIHGTAGFFNDSIRMELPGMNRSWNDTIQQCNELALSCAS